MPRRPIWLWPNLLSLDAPLVAVAWFCVFKEVWLVSYHQATLPWLLAVAVWCIYVADRLLDERRALPGAERDTPRHEFHRKWRRPMTIALGVGVLVALNLLFQQGRGLYANGFFLLILVVCYFAASFFDNGRIAYFKNFLAGLCFGYGTAIGVHFYSRDGQNILSLALAPEVIAFGMLCVVNMIAIDHWEASRKSEDEEEKQGYESVLTILLVLLAGFALVMAVRSEDYTLIVQKAFFIAIMVAAAALQVINRIRSRFSLDALRVLADIAMLLPLPIFFTMVKLH